MNDERKAKTETLKEFLKLWEKVTFMDAEHQKKWVDEELLRQKSTADDLDEFNDRVLFALRDEFNGEMIRDGEKIVAFLANGRKYELIVSLCE